MAATENAISHALESLSDPAGVAAALSTNQILSAMIKVSEKVSDLIFSPGRAPQVELNGKLMAVPGLAIWDPLTRNESPPTSWAKISRRSRR